MFGKLIPCGGGAPIPLGKTTLVIGRSPECDITVPCMTVSGRHCELHFDQDAWNIRDLDSKNGITVNGTRCMEQRLAPNDLLSVGKQRFIVSYRLREAKPLKSSESVDIEALALELLTSDDPPSPPLTPAASQESAALRQQSQAVHPPHQHAPHLSSKASLGRLVPCGGGDAIPLLREELLVGRHPACDICLRFPAISAKHCKLTWHEGYWIVEDLGSSNGTWVNGVRCQKKVLPPQSVLGLAKHRFIIHYTPTGAAPPPEEDDVFSQSLLQKAGLAKHFARPDAAAGKDEDDPDHPVRYRLDANDT